MMVFWGQQCWVVTHVGSISHDLVFHLLPPLQTLLNEHLGTEREGLGGQVAQLLLVVRESGTETTEGEGGTENDRVADLLGRAEGCFNGGDGGGLGCGNVDF